MKPKIHKNSRISRLSIVVLLVIMTISIITYLNGTLIIQNNGIQESKNYNPRIVNKIALKSTNNITITSNDKFAALALQKGWSGNSSKADPVIISGYLFNRMTFQSAISNTYYFGLIQIRNVSAYFIIENNSFRWFNNKHGNYWSDYKGYGLYPISFPQNGSDPYPQSEKFNNPYVSIQGGHTASLSPGINGILENSAVVVVLLSVIGISVVMAILYMQYVNLKKEDKDRNLKFKEFLRNLVKKKKVRKGPRGTLSEETLETLEDILKENEDTKENISE